MPTAIDSKRFLFVTGKGGVGKTTVAAAMAVGLAAHGKRVLCAMMQAKERLSRLLECQPIGEDVVQALPGVWAVNIDPEAALAEYGKMVLKLRAVYKAVFENAYVKSFFRATPGLHEWAMLGKAWYHTTESLPDGSRKYDVVIVDAPATGHGLDMLRGPKVIVDVAPPGLLRREAVKAWKLFGDPAQSGVVVVTQPEDMPVTETLELLEALEGELGLPVAEVVVNGVLPPLFSPEERAELLRPLRLEGEADGAEAVAAGARRSRRESIQHENLVRLSRGVRAPLVYLPQMFDEVATLEAVTALAKRLT